MIEILSDLENKKKNRRIFHPIFVAIFPILIIYSQNVGRVNVEDLILPIVIVSLFFSFSILYLEIHFEESIQGCVDCDYNSYTCICIWACILSVK